MTQAELFGRDAGGHPLSGLAERLWDLAREGIYLGTSSWKYEAWRGTVYAREYRSKKAFEHDCLEEYARTFPAVGGDFSFYNFPSADFIARLNSQTPEGFKIGLKCTDSITIRRFPNIARWGNRAGRDNPDFLNAKLFRDEFLARVAPLGAKLAPIILEFTAFPKDTFADWTEFAEELERFLDAVRMDGIEFGVEVRNRELFLEDFWAALKAMGAVPVLNSWTRMPPLDEQWKAFGRHGYPFVECRPVMRPGRTREEAVTLFEPYAIIRERCPPARAAMREMMAWARAQCRPCYIFVNNHLEGCAWRTIEELVSASPN